MTGSLRYDIENFPNLRGSDADEINTNAYWFNRRYLLHGVPDPKEHSVPHRTFHKNLVERLDLIFVPRPKNTGINPASLEMAVHSLGPEYKHIRFRPEARYLKKIN